MAHANEQPVEQPLDAESPSVLVGRLDHTLQRMRRVVLRPPGVGIPIPGLGRPVDIAKVLACEAISDLSLHVCPVTVTDVAHAMQLERSTVSRLLSDCEGEGLIQRVRVPDDGRRVGLEVTDDGRTAIHGSAQIRSDFLSYVTQSFDSADLSSLVSLIERFAEDMATALPEWLVTTENAAHQQPHPASSSTSRATSNANPAL